MSPPACLAISAGQIFILVSSEDILLACMFKFGKHRTRDHGECWKVVSQRERVQSPMLAGQCRCSMVPVTSPLSASGPLTTLDHSELFISITWVHIQTSVCLFAGKEKHLVQK